MSLTAIDDLGQVEDDMTDDETADTQKKGDIANILKTIIFAALYIMFASFAALALAKGDFLSFEYSSTIISE